MTPGVPTPRLPIVGVMGSGEDSHEDLARPLGEWLASQAVHLLTGGGAGVMAAVSEAFHSVKDRRGLTIGIVPCQEDSPDPPPGYPNPWIEIPIHTHLPKSAAKTTGPDSRNPINILSSAVIIALPGSLGTSSEVSLALHYGRPLIALVHNRSDIPNLEKQVGATEDLDEVKEFVRRHL